MKGGQVETTRGPEGTSQVQRHLVELFVQLCGAPDDATVGAEADRTLHTLEALLTTTATAESRE